MKYIIFLGDGMSDDPNTCKNGKTPLMIANKPNIDALAKNGECGLLLTIPSDLPAESTVANMSVLGYDVHKCYEGRGVLEAASMGVNIKKGEVAMRCNVICIENDKIKNHSAGHISSKEAKELISYLNKELGTDNIIFHNGVSYRHLLVLKKEASKEVDLTPPHDVPGEYFLKVMPKPLSKKGENTSKLLNDLILKSQKILPKHPVNIKRVKEGKDMANSIWPWSIGVKPKMKGFKEIYGIKGGVISAVDLIKGIGVYAGMEVINVNGATGLYDTNYEGKADAAINALKNNDFVYVHVEASDEAGHEGDFDLKVKTIEYLDKRLIGRCLEKLKDFKEPVRIAVLPDHPTPVALKTHTKDAVPFLICDLNSKKSNKKSKIKSFDEISVKKECKAPIVENAFIKKLLNS